MPDYTDVPISSFPDAQSVDASDKVTGLKSGNNTNFSFNSILAWLISQFYAVFLPASSKGTAGGVASLDSTGKLPSDQMPTITPSDIGAQPTIRASGILKGDGAGGVSAATAGTDYQDPLTFDNTPTASSNNPVKSGGVYDDVRTRVPKYGMGKNLLRNWYFVGSGTGHGVFPVNQRGKSSYYGNYYGVDGWKGQSGLTVTPNASYLSLSATSTVVARLYQYFDTSTRESLEGKTITLSILTDVGLFTQTGIYNASASVCASVNIYDSSGSTQLGAFFINLGNARFSINMSETINAKAVKLELGAEQTLCHNEGTDANPVWVLNEIPDYEYELYRCITSTADSTDTFANKSLATEQQLAVTQVGPKANRAYAANGYFCWNGLLYRATTAILNGADLTINTNCVQTTVMDEIIRLT